VGLGKTLNMSAGGFYSLQNPRCRRASISSWW